MSATINDMSKLILDMYISRIRILDMYISRIRIRDMYISQNGCLFIELSMVLHILCYGASGAANPFSICRVMITTWFIVYYAQIARGGTFGGRLWVL